VRRWHFGLIFDINMEQHPIFAALYNWIMIPQDWLGLGKQRQKVVWAAKGKVLELGIGTGLNLPYYQDVEKVVGIDPEPHMLKKARRKLKRASVPVELIQCSAEDLPFRDSSFDTVISTLVFCTIPEADKAAREAHRVLKPAGTFRFLEHVRTKTPILAKVQDILTPGWKKLYAGCHLNRDIMSIFRRNGFEIVELQNILHDVILRGVAKPNAGRGNIVS
jgi:ubiquinone/menaquinone biosynthesis C-methylase UbiE